MLLLVLLPGHTATARHIVHQVVTLRKYYCSAMSVAVFLEELLVTSAVGVMQHSVVSIIRQFAHHESCHSSVILQFSKGQEVCFERLVKLIASLTSGYQ